MGRPNINHVFVLMLENRSFDHMLGLSGIVGSDIVTHETRALNGPAGLSLEYQGTSYPIQSPGRNPMPHDVCHEFDNVLEQLCGSGVTYTPPYPPINIEAAGYISDYVSHASGTPGVQVNDPLQCLSPEQVPVICQLAQEFLVCDAWFSSMPGPTWPNRFFVHAASSGGLEHSPSQFETALWSLTGYAFEHGTIFDAIASKLGRGAFRIYYEDTPLAKVLKGMSTTYAANFFQSSLAQDLQSPDYKSVAYTFIEPGYGNWLGDFTCGTSQHPVDDVTRGEWLIKCTYEAIRNSPLWDDSLLIIVWDEHGGFYDHVPPPPTTPPGDKDMQSGTNASGFTFAQCGARVPAVIVSPLIEKNAIDGRVYENASVPATLEKLFMLNPLTERDRNVRDLEAVLALDSPRTDAPQELVSPAPGVKLPNCGPVTSCVEASGMEAQRAALVAAATAPDAEQPLVGDQPGFLMAALHHDLSVTPPIHHDVRLAQFQQLGPTRRDAAQFLLEVFDRVQATEAARRSPSPGA